ncbi:Coiled-coil domain-containing protein 40 [Kappamyces sp. JEL0829]|nr:Coiled-coil domain-containing protein 40 [Kappamyces sp. JEL0829]
MSENSQENIADEIDATVETPLASQLVEPGDCIGRIYARAIWLPKKVEEGVEAFALGHQSTLRVPAETPAPVISPQDVLEETSNHESDRQDTAQSVESNALYQTIQGNAPDTVEEEDDDLVMDPNHPLLERVQKAIFEQLSRHEQKLVLEVREKEEQATKETKRREDAGVELYNLQQQLARLQSTYEGAEENYGIIKALREDAERALKHSKSDYEKEQLKVKQHTKNMEQHQAELEKIGRTLKQVDLYNEELRSKILVAKRTTLKAEKDIVQQEMEKKRQDFFIDHLTEQLRKLQEKRATYDAQLAVQQRETQAAIQTLQDAATEMEAIQFEKRQLINQWKSSLIGLKKRDEMIAEIEAAITKQNETLAVMHTEITGYKRTIRKAQEDGENLTSVLNKLELEIEYIKRQIVNRGEDKEKLADQYSIFSKSMNQTESEISHVQQEYATVQAEIIAVQKATAQTTLSVQTLEREIAEKLKTQSSFQKGAQSAIKDGNKVRQLIHEKETAVTNHLNELSVIKLESLAAETRIDAMKEQLKKVDGEISEKNSLIGKYEQEMRQNNDLLSKRASEMDLLNKKYDQLTSGNVDSHMGPLEATIYNLTKSIHLKESECLQLQQYWLRAQNELVSISKKAVEHTDDIQNLRMRLTVLNRKKMVVNNAFETEEKQIKEHNRNIRQLQNEMIKVNTILSKQSSIYERLEESNLEMEQKFRNKLKDAELESIELEAQLEKLKDEKEEALQGLIESEYGSER